MSSNRARIAQAVLDGLEDLQITFEPNKHVMCLENLLEEKGDNDDYDDAGGSSTIKELELALQSKFQDKIPHCPLLNPTHLERLHFLVVSLQRESLIIQRRRLSTTTISPAEPMTTNETIMTTTMNRLGHVTSTTAATGNASDLSDEQKELIQSCDESLRADYTRRRQHMRQRFEILKASFGNAADVHLLGEDYDERSVLEIPPFNPNTTATGTTTTTTTTPLTDIAMTQLFLTPSSWSMGRNMNQNYHIQRKVDGTIMKDRGGRIMQGENRNHMPTFSKGPRLLAASTKTKATGGTSGQAKQKEQNKGGGGGGGGGRRKATNKKDKNQDKSIHESTNDSKDNEKSKEMQSGQDESKNNNNSNQKNSGPQGKQQVKGGNRRKDLSNKEEITTSIQNINSESAPPKTEVIHEHEPDGNDAQEGATKLLPVTGKKRSNNRKKKTKTINDTQDALSTKPGTKNENINQADETTSISSPNGQLDLVTAKEDDEERSKASTVSTVKKSTNQGKRGKAKNPNQNSPNKSVNQNEQIASAAAAAADTTKATMKQEETTATTKVDSTAPKNSHHRNRQRKKSGTDS